MKTIKTLGVIVMCVILCSCGGNNEAKKKFEREEATLKFISDQITGTNKLIEECNQNGDYETAKSLQLHKQDLIKQQREQAERRNEAFKEYNK